MTTSFLMSFKARAIAVVVELSFAGLDWLVREIRLYWKRLLKRLDMTSRSLVALIEPGSCFAGTLIHSSLCGW